VAVSRVHHTPVEHARLVRGGTAFYPADDDTPAPDAWDLIADGARWFLCAVGFLALAAFAAGFLGRYFGLL
jgi:hypothetical protein